MPRHGPRLRTTDGGAELEHEQVVKVNNRRKDTSQNKNQFNKFVFRRHFIMASGG